MEKYMKQEEFVEMVRKTIKYHTSEEEFSVECFMAFNTLLCEKREGVLVGNGELPPMDSWGYPFYRTLKVYPDGTWSFEDQDHYWSIEIHHLDGTIERKDNRKF